VPFVETEAGKLAMLAEDVKNMNPFEAEDFKAELENAAKEGAIYEGIIKITGEEGTTTISAFAAQVSDAITSLKGDAGAIYSSYAPAPAPGPAPSTSTTSPTTSPTYSTYSTYSTTPSQPMYSTSDRGAYAIGSRQRALYSGMWTSYEDALADGYQFMTPEEFSYANDL
jgi:hypothetical protein